MEPIDLILKIWGIHEEHRVDVEDILKTTPPKHLGLSLAMLAQPEDENDLDKDSHKWMETYLPELRFV